MIGNSLDDSLRTELVLTFADLTLDVNQAPWFLENYAGIKIDAEWGEYLHRVERVLPTILAEDEREHAQLSEFVNHLKRKGE